MVKQLSKYFEASYSHDLRQILAGSVCWDHERIEYNNTVRDDVDVDVDDAADISEVPTFNLNDLEVVPEDNYHQDVKQSTNDPLKNNKRTVSFRFELLFVNI